MSTSLEKRTLADATTDAERFRALFDGCYEKWEFAGSVRRRVPRVGDVEHVVIPRFGEVVDGSGLFSTTRTANLLWERMDELVRTYALKQHEYGEAGTHRWGVRYRGVDFRGFCHEVFAADEHNWGSVLAIRTGPGSYSKMLVTVLQRYGHMNEGGYVWNKSDMTCTCGWRGMFAGGEQGGLAFIAPEDWPASEGKPKWINGRDRAGVCPDCRSQTGLSMARVSVPSELTYFDLCRVRWVQPWERQEIVMPAAPAGATTP